MAHFRPTSAIFTLFPDIEPFDVANSVWCQEYRFSKICLKWWLLNGDIRGCYLSFYLLVVNCRTLTVRIAERRRSWSESRRVSVSERRRFKGRCRRRSENETRNGNSTRKTRRSSISRPCSPTWSEHAFVMSSLHFGRCDSVFLAGVLCFKHVQHDVSVTCAVSLFRAKRTYVIILIAILICAENKPDQIPSFTTSVYLWKFKKRLFAVSI